MRIGILSMAHVHAPPYTMWAKTSGTLAGIWDDDVQRGQAAAEQYGTTFYAHLGTLLEQVDAVVICAENIKHKDLAVAAARAGKHVLSEKPLATTVEDGLAMIEAAKQAGVVLMTAMPCRFHPTYVRVKAAIDNGEIGTVVGISATNHGQCPFSWFTDPELAGGGAVMDHTVHVADMLRHLLDSEVKSVYAVADRRFYDDIKSDDCGYLSMEFENGVIASLDPSWSRPHPFATWGDVTMEVMGTHGTITLDMFGQNLDVWVNGNAWANWGSDANALMLENFVEACTKGAPLKVSGEDGIRAAEVALLAYKSVQTGRAVTRLSGNEIG